MVHLFNLDDVNDRHGDVDVDRDVDTVHFVKAEWCNFLVVIVLLRMTLTFTGHTATHLHEE